MKFNTTQDAISYLQQNTLFNIPVSLELHLFEKPKIEVWFGQMEFGRFNKEDDWFEMCVIHDIAEKLMMEDNDNLIEDYMESNGYGGYFIPSQFDGEVVFTNQYVRDNNNE